MTGRTKQRLQAGLPRLNIELSDHQIETLVEFLALLVKWNRTYRLTAVTDPDEMVSRHLLDSLSVLPFIVGPRVLDVGSGAGLPGIPLAVARAEFEFTLLDSNGKKTRFMTHAAGRLGLDNVRILRARVEDYADEIGFDTVISRAFSSLVDFVERAGHLCSETGCLLAMKGRLRDEEMTTVPAGWGISTTRRLSVPGVKGCRHLVVMTRNGQH
jgi:16S rRNA (guanine527-N7)-methyltransferase